MKRAPWVQKLVLEQEAEKNKAIEEAYEKIKNSIIETKTVGITGELQIGVAERFKQDGIIIEKQDGRFTWRLAVDRDFPQPDYYDDGY